MKSNTNFPLISIIVPVFNVEKYIYECINSVLQQPFKDVELILVNDGSPDRCPEICDEYAARDSRVKVIHKKNGGVGEARNKGIESAIGKYIMFVDSDDYLKNDCLTSFSKIMIQAGSDVIIGNFETVKEFDDLIDWTDKILDEDRINGQTAENALTYLTRHGLIITPWRYITKRELIVNKKLFFRPGIFHEDVDWVPIVLCNANSFWYLKEPFYGYRIRAGSISTSKRLKSLTDSFDIIKRLFLYSQNLNDKNKEKYLLLVLYWQLFPIFKKYNSYSSECRLVIRNWTKENSLVVGYTLRRNPKLYFFKHCFGVRIGTFLFCKINTLKSCLIK